MSPTSKEFSKAEVEILLKLDRLEATVDRLEIVSSKNVTLAEFAPIQKIVYGMVGVILLSYIGAITAFVLK